uniref:Uncharacterized protein n=1 Tax=Zea mays TaxID=4577 RepID=B4FNR7_MAIZE|nr:unknown [Zea mays]
MYCSPEGTCPNRSVYVLQSSKF